MTFLKSVNIHVFAGGTSVVPSVCHLIAKIYRHIFYNQQFTEIGANGVTTEAVQGPVRAEPRHGPGRVTIHRRHMAATNVPDHHRLPLPVIHMHAQVSRMFIFL